MIKLNFWEKIKYWLFKDMYNDYAEEMCYYIKSAYGDVTLDDKKRAYDMLMDENGGNDWGYSKLHNYALEKHKRHMFG